jgi:hypothetical protein
MLGMVGRKRSVDLLSLIHDLCVHHACLGDGRWTRSGTAAGAGAAAGGAERGAHDGRSRQCADEALQRKEEGVAMLAAALEPGGQAAAAPVLSNTNHVGKIVIPGEGSGQPQSGRRTRTSTETSAPRGGPEVAEPAEGEGRGAGTDTVAMFFKRRCLCLCQRQHTASSTGSLQL